MNKQEFKYIIYSGIFITFWFLFAVPYLLNNFDSSSPFTQFILFNLGLYIFLFIFLKSIVTNTSINLKTALGLVSLFVGLDIIMPEYHVLISGVLVKGAAMGASASDYVVGLLAQNMGLSGLAIYIVTYLIAPVLLFFIASKLMGNFVRSL